MENGEVVWTLRLLLLNPLWHVWFKEGIITFMKLFGFALEVLQITERLGHFMGNYLLMEHGKITIVAMIAQLRRPIYKIGNR